MDRHTLILASASPRRRKILDDLNLSFEVMVTSVPEDLITDDPHRTAETNALRKCEVCRNALVENGRAQPDMTYDIMAADTVVVFEERCIPKPDSIEQATAFLRMFSGKTHSVLTCVAFLTLNTSAPNPSATPELKTVESSVTFKTLTDTIIRSYFEKVDPLDKAGAYDIDQHGDMIIASWSGSYTNIMGLPVELMCA